MKKLWLAALVLGLAGCPRPLPPATQTGPTPTYAELVRRFNRNLRYVDELSATGQVEMFWRDDKGKHRHEQADCRLKLIAPDKMALLINHIGAGDLFWAGSDATRYWLFDLTDSDHRKLYVGRHDRIDAPGRKALPVPAQPRDLPRLLGIRRIDPIDFMNTPPVVKPTPEGFVIAPPGGGYRLTLDPQTAMAVRVELLDKQGRTTVESRLSDPVSVAMAKLPPGDWPTVMSRIRIVRLDGDEDPDRIVMTILTWADNDDDKPIARNIFDLDWLTKHYKVEPANVVDLDAAQKR